MLLASRREPQLPLLLIRRVSTRESYPAFCKPAACIKHVQVAVSLEVALKHDCNVHRYDEPACKWKQDELDHSVMLVGYGSTEGGKDYWTVK
jgi:Papain family cysteine protease